jgi:N-acetylneuraminic acid mutarotase
MRKAYMLKFSLILCLALIHVNKIYPQQNPLYAPNSSYLNPQTQHWLFTVHHDTINGSWNFITSLPQALFGVNAYYWPQNGKVFICGGANSTSVPTKVCRWYNIASNTYEPADSLPRPRWGGKLVRVRDSLYLVGSVDSSFTTPDGLIFKYSLNQNLWVMKDTMNTPFVIEPAACVINDSLILTIGGSTNAFAGTTNRCRIYNPRTDKWTTLLTPYPSNVSTAHAEYSDDDTVVVVLGGYNAGSLSTIYSGHVQLDDDSTQITWELYGSTIFDSLFGTGVYRVAGAKWNNYMLFGPAMNGSTASNMIFGLRFADSTWSTFLPKTIDTVGNISTYGVKPGTDTNYFFIFGGFKNPNVVSSAQMYTFATPPPPIGIINLGGNIPKVFELKQNYPNPFNPVTHFEFRIARSGFASLKIYDILGREIAVLVNEKLNPGTYKAEWNASSFPSGVYFYRLSAADFSQTKKMVLIK